MADTPAQFGPSPPNTCDPTQDTCAAPGLDPVENHMGFNIDGCQDRFTPGQVARMDASWATYRLGR